MAGHVKESFLSHIFGSGRKVTAHVRNLLRCIKLY